MFQTGVTPTFTIRSRLYTGSSPFCATDGSVNGTVRPHSTSLVYSDPFEIPIAGISATHREKTYTAIAARLIPLPVGSVDLARRAWVLCERAP